MRKKIPSILTISLLVIITTVHFAIALPQSNPVSTLDSLDITYHNWYNMDPNLNNIQGTGIDRAYSELLNDKRPKEKIIVAVIDGGVDIEHEDIKGKIWINGDEISDNGKDDDKNGYIDDIHGWNFIGNAKGENIKHETLEQVRMLRKLEPLYQSYLSIDEVPDDKKEEFRIYNKCKSDYQEKLAKYKTLYKNFEDLEKNVDYYEKVISDHLGKTDFTPEEVYDIGTSEKNVKLAKKYLTTKYKQGFSRKSLEKKKEHCRVYLDKHFNIDFNPREIISDNPEDINDINYGNNDVKGPTSEHGTFVAGIIAANRSNNIGIDGIASNVEIMVLRTVPDGDERDKDVALSIRYAVDNGARIINMSFGKDFSPQKQFVDDAIKYAEENNVLLIHASGNDGSDLDVITFYPTNVYNDGSRAKNWINVGATSTQNNKKFCGNFSNYGKQNVDLFAPGVNILSLSPENKYVIANGTSFSSPVVSGVAALVLSCYPELTALELKDIILNSCTLYPKLKVYYPGSKSKKRKKTKFHTLSSTGGVVNAYKALKLAEKEIKGK
ncbi:MAG: S8 family serine peptidase [Bacteroidota bacterium]